MAEDRGVPEEAAGDRVAGPRGIAARPAFAAAEAVVFVGAIIAFIWWLQPLGDVPVDVLSLAAIVGMTLVSHHLHGDTAGRIGFRLDNLRPAARAAAAPTLIMALVLIGTGLAFGSVRLDYGQLALGLAFYPIWGLVQQYALQGMVLVRLEDAGLGGRSASLAAAGLFALCHMPNPGLVVMVLVAGWVWCDLFRRRPNLLVLAVSHGWLATVAVLVLPTVVTGDLRIGPDYLAHFVHGAAH